MDRMLDEDEDDPQAWAIRRYQELYVEFSARHPAQLKANSFIDGLFQASRCRGYSNRLDREAERSGDDLFVSYHQLSDVFNAAPVDIREHLFRLLTRVMTASQALGEYAAPEGRSARDKRSNLAGAKGRALEVAVRVYCEVHGIEPKTSEKFAGIIRPHVLELLGLPKRSKSPAIRTIVKALHDVRESSAAQ